MACQIVQRLKTRSQFQTVLNGTTVARTAHFALHKMAVPDGDVIQDQRPQRNGIPLAKSLDGASKGIQKISGMGMTMFPGDDAWIGALVPKRWAKRAVTRNAIKRQIYSVSAAMESLVGRAAYVVRLRTQFDKKQFPSANSVALKELVSQELVLLFDKNQGVRMARATRGGTAPGSQ